MIAIADLRVTCESVPVQMEGHLTNGLHLYFRARYRHAALGIGPTPEDAAAAAMEHTPGGPPIPHHGIGVARELCGPDDPFGAGGIAHDDGRALAADLLRELVRDSTFNLRCVIPMEFWADREATRALFEAEARTHGAIPMTEPEVVPALVRLNPDPTNGPMWISAGPDDATNVSVTVSWLARRAPVSAR